jgi:hypothetical protein
MRITLNLEPKHAFTLLSLLVLVVGFSLVVASPLGTKPDPGHSGSELQPGSIDRTRLADNAVGSTELLSDSASLPKVSGGRLSVSGSNIIATNDVCANGGSPCLSGAGGGGVPSGAVMFFNLASCPSGWTELTTARGRYVVGLPASGSLAGTAGTALSNLENRAVGQHTHGITDPGHAHTYTPPVYTSTGSGSSKAGVGGATSTSSNPTGISIQNTGTVAGTNAPYIQLLACQKS